MNNTIFSSEQEAELDEGMYFRKYNILKFLTLIINKMIESLDVAYRVIIYVNSHSGDSQISETLVYIKIKI